MFVWSQTVDIEWCEHEEEGKNNESLNKEKKENEKRKTTKRRIHFHFIRFVDLNTGKHLFIDLSLVTNISNQNGASPAFYDGWSFGCHLFLLHFSFCRNFIGDESKLRSSESYTIFFIWIFKFGIARFVSLSKLTFRRILIISDEP